MRVLSLARGTVAPEHRSQLDVLPLGYACAVGPPLETPGPHHRARWPVLVVPALDDGAAW